MEQCGRIVEQLNEPSARELTQTKNTEIMVASGQEGQR
jgi:hypothetical protein